MKQIFVNLKRFDVHRDLGGVCSDSSSRHWIENIIDVCAGSGKDKLEGIELVFMLPESLIISAVERLARHPSSDASAIKIGCQGVFREDIAKGGNFGAFTCNRPASAAKSLGCDWTIIGHSEERKDKLQIIASYDPRVLDDAGIQAGASGAVSNLINKELICALKRELNVLLCVGETASERGEGVFEEQKPRIQAVLEQQLEIGLAGLDFLASEGRGVMKRRVVIGYEPIWAIGPGKLPPGAGYIDFVSSAIKEVVARRFHFDPTVVYGGGLKEENAAMIASVPGIGGGLVALTQFSGDIGFYPEQLMKIIEKYKQEG